MTRFMSRPLPSLLASYAGIICRCQGIPFRVILPLGALDMGLGLLGMVVVVVVNPTTPDPLSTPKVHFLKMCP